MKRQLQFKDTYLYKIYGLIVKANFNIPTLELSLYEGENEPDIVVIYDEEKNIIEEDLINRCISGLESNYSYHRVRKVAKFYITNGNTIYIDKVEEATMDKMTAFLLGKVFGICFRQRGIIALHGSSILINNKAALFIGKSGSGKSTLAAAMRTKGYKFIGDEVEILKVDDRGKAMSVPSYPCNRLSAYAIENLGLAVQGELDVEKMHYLKVSEECCKEPQPVGAIFEIQQGDVSKVQIKEVQGKEKVELFFRHNYMKSYVGAIPVTKDYFKECMTIIKAVPMYIIERPKEEFTVFDQLKLVEEKCL
ncbi:MAG: hypothetical protein RR128_05410 [Clostridium sp.]